MPNQGAVRPATLVAAAVAILAIGVVVFPAGEPEPAPEVPSGPASERPPERPAGLPSSPPMAQPVVPPPPPEPDVLMSFVPGPGGCSWQVRELPDTTSSTLRVTETCPREVTWDRRTGVADSLFVVDPFTRTLTRIGPAGPEPVTLPQPAGSWLVNAWIAEESGRLRVGYILGIPCVQDGDVCSYDVGGRTIQSERDASGFERFEMIDGWAALRSSERGWVSLPSWGSIGVAVAYDADPRGGWTMVSAAPTRAEAGDTPGLAVLDLAEAAGTFNLSTLRRAATCLAQRIASTGCGDSDVALPAAIAERVGDPSSEVGTVASDGGSWIFPIIYGDTPHARGPVLRECGTGCAPVPLDLPMPESAQLGLSVNGPYLLVAREYSLTEAAVFEPGSSEPVLVLPADALTVWLPR